MKSIILSVQPQFVAKILNGEKTIEIRKSCPKETPFKVYVYCTKDKLKNGKYLYLNPIEKRKDLGVTEDWSPLQSFLTINGGTINEFDCDLLNGKVVAEFICDKVDKIINHGSGFHIDGADTAYTNLVAKESCLDFKDLQNYFKGKNGFALHISDLKIYDKPKELNDFRPYCNKKEKCWKDVVRHCDDVFSRKCMDLVINKPPQSWQYVEELK